jgi:transposase
MKNSNVVGIDLAKHVIQVCKIDKHGELISNKAISPSKLKELLAKTVPSIVAMEGCGACHYWARLAQKHGHDVRVISPKKVKGFLQGHKTDANDALAIAIASIQLGMRFSQIKTEEQQSLQTLEPAWYEVQPNKNRRAAVAANPGNQPKVFRQRTGRIK